MTLTTLIIIVLFILVLLCGGYIISTYNKFIKMKNDCDEAFSTMDVYLKKRYDLIPNIVETVKGYASHEKETLENVIKARDMAQGANEISDKIAGENAISSTLKSLFAIAEAYPDLKANTNFLDLQNQLKLIEEDIANSRKFYNGVVKTFNTRTETFPSNLIAGIFKFTGRPLYEVDNEAERQNVKVSF